MSDAKQINQKSQNHMEYRSFPFQIIETKSSVAGFSGDKCYGVVKGYASTYGNVDRCNDIILEGAFADSIQDYKNKQRQVKVYYQHNSLGLPIGGIPHDNIESDKAGLPVSININKDVQLGREVYALATQGVLSDMSIGYTVDDADYNKDGQRLLKKLTLWEVSIVGEPANPQAKISEVKSLKKFYTVNDVKNIITKKDYEDALRESGAFSKEAATFLAAHFIEKSRRESDQNDETKTLASLKELTQLLNKI